MNLALFCSVALVIVLAAPQADACNAHKMALAHTHVAVIDCAGPSYEPLVGYACSTLDASVDRKYLERLTDAKINRVFLPVTAAKGVARRLIKSSKGAKEAKQAQLSQSVETFVEVGAQAQLSQECRVTLEEAVTMTQQVQESCKDELPKNVLEVLTVMGELLQRRIEGTEHLPEEVMAELEKAVPTEDYFLSRADEDKPSMEIAAEEMEKLKTDEQLKAQMARRNHAPPPVFVDVSADDDAKVPQETWTLRAKKWCSALPQDQAVGQVRHYYQFINHCSVPLGWAPFSKRFAPSCDAHDVDYYCLNAETWPERTRKQADKRFHKRMIVRCYAAYPKRWLHAIPRGFCLLAGDMYHGAVKLFGADHVEATAPAWCEQPCARGMAEEPIADNAIWPSAL